MSRCPLPLRSLSPREARVKGKFLLLTIMVQEFAVITCHHWLMRTIIHAPQNIYLNRDLFQSQDKWFPARPGSFPRLQTGDRHAHSVQEPEDTRGHAQARVSSHHRGQGGARLGEVPRGQVSDRELHLGGGHQVPGGAGREQEQGGERGQAGGGESGGWRHPGE